MKMPTVMTMIETRFAGPTDARGSRVIARNVNNHKSRKTVSWDHSLDAEENHIRAARALGATCGKTDVLCRSSVDGGGYIFVMGVGE